VLELAGSVFVVVAVAAARFLSGRPLLHQVGPADSTYTTWAPPVPDEVALMRVVIPRTSWGRRPGWQRQATRLLAVAVVVAFLAAPVVTVAALAGAGAAGAAGWVARVACRPLAPAEHATAAPFESVAARAGVRGQRRDALSQQQHGPDASDPAAWVGGAATVRAQAHRMDQGGVVMRARSGGMRRHGGRRGPAPVVAFPIGWWIAWELVAATWRFVAGQVVLRRPGRYDARYRTWAAPIPANMELTRTEGIPRCRWARRPGYQRQLVRLAALAVPIGWFAAPTWTVAVLTGATVLAIARVAWRWGQAVYYQRVCGPFLDWLSERLGWEGVEEDPRRWIQLPPYRFEAAPVAPLRAAVLRTGNPDGEGDGWLARHAPRVAGWLEPLTTPIAETRWARWLTDLPAGRPAWLAVAARWIGRRIVAVIEASRLLRVRPRLVCPDLTNPDAEIRIAYPPSYQAHGSNVDEVKRVIAERLDGDEWELRKDAKALTFTVYHPTRLPTRVEWTRDIFAKYSQLEAPIGETARGVMTINYKHATPHVNASGRTGTGKTVTFLTIIGNFLYHGGRAVIVDPKRIDFVKPFRNLHNVDLVTVEDQFPHVLHDVVQEMDRRYALIEKYTVKADEMGLPDMGTNAELYFQPLMLAIDEKSRFTAKCKAWWRREGGGYDDKGKPIAGKGDPITVEWERDAVARARAAAIYVMAAAQQNAIPNTFPDTDIRGNYQYKILSGAADGPSWIVTFPGQRFKKLSSQVKGRAIVGVGSDLHEVQLAYMDWQEVRAAAQRGETVMDAENQKRAERLAELTGRPVWEVSPLPWWVPVPAETGRGVGGQDTSGDTPAPAPAAPLALIAGPSTETAGQGEESVAEPITVEPLTGPPGKPESNISLSNGSTEARCFAVRGRDAERITGNAAAARHVGVSRDAFTRARTRAKNRGEGDVPGIGYDGLNVSYDPVQLAEWWSQRPGSGRKAS
jgi:hypothetical protein